MRVKGLQIDFPVLRGNPFSTSPLETGQKSLYVGRLDIRGRISRHINFRSNRRLLLVGEMGSGRTSLLRCSASEAPVYVHIDHISASNPAHSLLENLYSELIDYNIPKSRNELVHKIVEASRTYESKIPLIVIDMPTVETSVMTVALRDALPSLERLQAVIVVVIEPKQRSNLPDSILHSFASIETLEPLSVDEVKVLVEKRVSSVTSKEFKLSSEDAQNIHSISGGKPSEVIRYMRDSIDQSIHSNPSEQNYKTEYDLINSNYKSEQEDEIIHESSINHLPEEIQEVQLDELDADIIDASIPWQQREPVNDNSIPSVEVSDIFGFDLDLEELSDSKLEDQPIEEFTFSATPDNEEIIIVDSNPRPSINAGTFNALLGRTRDFSAEADDGPREMVKDDQSKGAELWVSKDLIEPPMIETDYSEEDSAALIHDEIGLPEFDSEQSLDLGEIVNEYQELDQINEIDNSQNHNYDQLSPLIKALHDLLITNVSSDSGSSNTNRLAEALSKMRREKQGEKQDFTLNPLVLSSLSNSESYVVSIAQQRRYSPSDKEILNELKIKRPRLSQISNRLLKSGILNVRTVGRSRYFQLTQAARAQLTAWGLIGGVE
ncbi:MAG: hypothetical protein CBE08_004815 [Euryarchaeota archaeon TMED248]|nr:MAG: hypothetical protein CBE08_004815 [Euryarchaeota archaeon TMED248]|tara:strand:+ start:129 stop:1949 length:1821 start_codon:yes stop_codon:yes gene_type:complete